MPELATQSSTHYQAYGGVIALESYSSSSINMGVEHCSFAANYASAKDAVRGLAGSAGHVCMVRMMIT